MAKRHRRKRIGVLPALDSNAIKGISRPRNPRQKKEKTTTPTGVVVFLLERITGLEPATSTLARSRSTK